MKQQGFYMMYSMYMTIFFQNKCSRVIGEKSVITKKKTKRAINNFKRKEQGSMMPRVQVGFSLMQTVQEKFTCTLGNYMYVAIINARMALF